MRVFKIVKKELMCHIDNLLVLFLILQSIIMCSVCSFFTISYIRVFHRLKRNIFMGNTIAIYINLKDEFKNIYLINQGNIKRACIFHAAFPKDG